ncbi:MAG: tRNA pseudouridine(55) synthase TruB [Lachnospiraceae bacterium]|nr:tRNA pseudouridine(55) synthase TruB [Lachnospiraceae bacterium]
MYNGVIIVNKEAGFTSHDVVAKLRGILKQKKIGHTGTLDPDATGVLPVCLGCATKLCDMLTDKDKTYEAVMLLGQATDTQDTSGKIISETNVSELRAIGELDDDKIINAVESFIGDYNQIPPMYSALKVNGKKLYELAREGIEIEREARPVKIISIENIRIEFPRVYMTVTCSKGTYIRTLCNDIGEKLGCKACMASLKRTQVSMFDIKDSLTLDEISKLRDESKVEKKIISVEQVFCKYPKIQTDEKFDRLLYNGNSVKASMLKDDESVALEDGKKYRMYDSKDTFIGVFYYVKKEAIVKCDKMFYVAEV